MLTAYPIKADPNPQKLPEKCPRNYSREREASCKQYLEPVERSVRNWLKSWRTLENRCDWLAVIQKITQGATETVFADISDLDQTIRAVSGSTVVYLLIGLKYDLKIWGDLWPRIMNNAIEACKRTGAKLIFFDNVYMYGKVIGRMIEETPFNPCSKKGEIRARIAVALLNEVRAGKLNAMIARSADFYGPHARSSIANIMVFDKFVKGATASCLVNDAVAHSYTFTPDAARSLALLADTESAWNQTWHVPTAANPPTGKEFIQMVAKEFGVKPKYRVLNRPLIKVVGLFNPDIRESYEMLYQSDSEYLFDSTKFSTAFSFEPTSYAEGIRGTALACKTPVT
jgi:nucleoside-diphosphate-sugar epimerase